MKNLKTLLLIATLACSHAFAKDHRLGAGSLSGNYTSMANDIVSYCAEDLQGDTITVLESGGSVDNLIGMTNKKFSMGIVQEDVLNFHAKRSPKKVNRNNIKVVAPLHVEAMHLLVPKGYKPKTGKKPLWDYLVGSDDDKPVKIDLEMLRNQSVGAWGGSIVSAQALSFFFNLNMNVTEVPEGSQGKLPIVYVTGYPSKIVESYLESGKYHLVSLNYEAVSQRASFYTKETLNYSIKGKVQSVPTIGVQALLVGKSFRKASRNEGSTLLATCISENLPDLADDPDTNPLWGGVYEYVEEGNQTQWSHFPLNEQ